MKKLRNIVRWKSCRKSMGTKKRTPLSKERKALMRKIQEWGHRVHVVLSVREVVEVLACYGIRPRVAL